MPDYTIKKVTEADVEELQNISRETFKKTFDPYTASSDMGQFLKEDYAADKLIGEINNPP